MTLSDSPRHDLQVATTWLFVPGMRPDRFERASVAGADEIILDLEDSVAATDKAAARDHVTRWLASGRRGWVRVNGPGPEQHADVAAIAATPGLRGVLVPKADRTTPLQAIREAVGPALGLVALIESARGVRDARSIAESGFVDRLALGAIDLAVDLGCSQDNQALLLARSELVLASRCAGLPGPIESPTASLRDSAMVERDAAHARSLGFAGKLCIHPDQLAPTKLAFKPTAEEGAWARSVLAASRNTDGAVALDGEMIDRPVVLRAEYIVSLLDRGTTTGSDR